MLPQRGGDEEATWGDVLKLPIWDLSCAQWLNLLVSDFFGVPGAGAAFLLRVPELCPSVLSPAQPQGFLGQQQPLPVLFPSQSQHPCGFPFSWSLFFRVRAVPEAAAGCCARPCCQPSAEFCFCRALASFFSPCLVLPATCGPGEPPRLVLKLEQA